jgi:hypothetical protein
MSADGTGGAGAEGLQFDKVDLATPDEARACRICKRAIESGGEYFEIASNIICKSCAASLSGSKQGRGSLVRASLFGAGAALLGTIAWYAITKISGYQLGLVAIAVGLFVGRAVRKGGSGLGGWRYQALAMVLTYVSITASYVPLILSQAREAKAHRAAPGAEATAPETEATAPNADRTDRTDDTDRGSATDTAVPRSKPGAGDVVLAVALLLGLAFVSPFLAGASNFMGIVIIGIALYEAWKSNRRVPLSGPFRFGPAAAPLVAAAPGGTSPPAARS